VKWWRALQRRMLAEKAAEATQAREMAEERLREEKFRLVEMSMTARSLSRERERNQFAEVMRVAFGGQQ
jgi:hypothetical protein